MRDSWCLRVLVVKTGYRINHQDTRTPKNLARKARIFGEAVISHPAVGLDDLLKLGIVQGFVQVVQRAKTSGLQVLDVGEMGGQNEDGSRSVLVFDGLK